jgi:catalase
MGYVKRASDQCQFSIGRVVRYNFYFLSGGATRYDHRDANDEYTQAGNLFRLMNPEQRERLFGDIARHMQAGNTSQKIQVRQICHFLRDFVR